jgi:ArsR family transcriptional regulator, arsenate/arsenite/antimonite-responsive transcriptional repressor
VKKLADHQFHAISRALAEPRRFAIFQQIAAAEDAVACCDLHEQEAISPATISHHLKELSEAGLITVQHEGRAAKLSMRRDVWREYLNRLGSIG